MVHALEHLVVNTTMKKTGVYVRTEQPETLESDMKKLIKDFVATKKVHDMNFSIKHVNNGLYNIFDHIGRYEVSYFIQTYDENTTGSISFANRRLPEVAKQYAQELMNYWNKTTQQ